MPGSTVTFRSAGRGDVGDIVALVESAYRGESSRQGWTTEADLLDGQRTDAAEVADLVAAPDGLVVLAVDGADLLGCCHLRLRPGEAGYFGMFAVSPLLQGRGTGRALLAEAERLAAASGAEAMQMTVLDQRPDLVAWYERLGYRRTGETLPFPYNEARFGLPKRTDLYFAVLERSLERSVG